MLRPTADLQSASDHSISATVERHETNQLNRLFPIPAFLAARGAKARRRPNSYPHGCVAGPDQGDGPIRENGSGNFQNVYVYRSMSARSGCAMLGRLAAGSSIGNRNDRAIVQRGRRLADGPLMALAQAE